MPTWSPGYTPRACTPGRRLSNSAATAAGLTVLPGEKLSRAGSAAASAEPGVIEVADEFCPWNQGRWRVKAGAVERTNAPADLSGDVTALGSVYLGGFTWAQLARALRVTELRPGAAARADALFRHDVGPWCPEIF